MNRDATADELLARLNDMDQASAEASLKYRAARTACSLAERRWLTTLDAVERAHTAWLVALSRGSNDADEIKGSGGSPE